MAAGCAEIALALAELPIFCGRFQTAAHRNLDQSVIQWRHCCRSMKKRVLLPRALPRFTGSNVLIFNTPLRRIGNDPDQTTAAAANFNVHADGRFNEAYCRVTGAL